MSNLREAIYRDGKMYVLSESFIKDLVKKTNKTEEELSEYKLVIDENCTIIKREDIEAGTLFYEVYPKNKIKMSRDNREEKLHQLLNSMIKDHGLAFAEEYINFIDDVQYKKYKACGDKMCDHERCVMLNATSQYIEHCGNHQCVEDKEYREKLEKAFESAFKVGDPINCDKCK